MADFNRSQIFNGTCAPFIYIRDCPTKHRDAYITTSRFWLACNSLVLIVLAVSFIRRIITVKEQFNTLRLAMLCFGVGIPLYVFTLGAHKTLPKLKEPNQDFLSEFPTCSTLITVVFHLIFTLRSLSHCFMLV